MRIRKNHASCVIALLAIAVSSIASADEFWSLSNYEDTNSGEAIVALQQEASDRIPDTSGKDKVTPLLEFHCVAGRGEAIQFRVNWKRFISSFNTEVGFRVDGGKTLWLKLGVDASNEITHAKSSSDIAKIIEQFSSGNTAELDVAPYSEPSVLVHFDISTFKAALESLKQSCL